MTVIEHTDLERAFDAADDSFCHIKRGSVGTSVGEPRPALCGAGLFPIHYGKATNDTRRCPVCGKPVCPDCEHVWKEARKERG